eukprot:NODE_738_length_4687_cov_0.308849.p7 type:complete len:136 gc:universal NODE_738_length_4687_cov_0.308849:3888-4295(+)
MDSRSNVLDNFRTWTLFLHVKYLIFEIFLLVLGANSAVHIRLLFLFNVPKQVSNVLASVQPIACWCLDVLDLSSFGPFSKLCAVNIEFLLDCSNSDKLEFFSFRIEMYIHIPLTPFLYVNENRCSHSIHQKIQKS